MTSPCRRQTNLRDAKSSSIGAFENLPDLIDGAAREGIPRPDFISREEAIRRMVEASMPADDNANEPPRDRGES
jgi:hypothetical protein